MAAFRLLLGIFVTIKIHTRNRPRFILKLLHLMRVNLFGGRFFEIESSSLGCSHLLEIYRHILHLDSFASIQLL